MSNRVLLLLILTMTLHIAAGAFAQSLRMLGAENAADAHVDASLIAQHDTWNPGTTVTVGLRLAMDEGWHTYWKNPGDAGMPTSITWDLPDGWTAHAIDWPAPVYFETNGIGGYGYVGTVVLPVRLDVPPDAAPGPVTLQAKANWLECADICVAGSADLQLIGRVGNDEPRPVAEHAELFSVAEARQPSHLSSFRQSAIISDGKLLLTVAPPVGPDQKMMVCRTYGDLNVMRLEPATSPNLKIEGRPVRFFPDRDDLVAMSEEQVSHLIDSERLRVALPLSSLNKEIPDNLAGVLVLEAPTDGKIDKLNGNTPRVWRIDVPVETLPSSEP